MFRAGIFSLVTVKSGEENVKRILLATKIMSDK